MGPVIMKCRHCGSSNVVRDAWAEWDTKTQTWELQQTFDYAYCMDCDGETSIDEEPMPEVKGWIKEGPAIIPKMPKELDDLVHREKR